MGTWYETWWWIGPALDLIVFLALYAAIRRHGAGLSIIPESIVKAREWCLRMLRRIV